MMKETVIRLKSKRRHQQHNNKIKNHQFYTEYFSADDDDEKKFELTEYIHELPCKNRVSHENECLHGKSHICHKQNDTDFVIEENEYYEKQTLRNHPIMKRHRCKLNCYNSDNDEAQTDNYFAYQCVHALPQAYTHEKHIEENICLDHDDYVNRIKEMKSYHPVNRRQGNIQHYNIDDDVEESCDMHRYEHVHKLQNIYYENEQKYREINCGQHESTFCTVHDKYNLKQNELYRPVNSEENNFDESEKLKNSNLYLCTNKEQDKDILLYGDRRMCFEHPFTTKSPSIVDIKPYHPRKGKIYYFNPKNKENSNIIDNKYKLHRLFSHYTQTHDSNELTIVPQESVTQNSMEKQYDIIQKPANISIDDGPLTCVNSTTAYETQSRDEIVKPLVSTLVMTDDKLNDSTTKVTLVDKKSKQEIQKSKNISTRMDWNNYHRLGVIYKFLDDLEYDFPAICTVGAIGNSLEGRDIKILRISNGNTKNASVWMDAGIHAREWIAPAVATYVANHIVRNFNSLPDSVTSKDWYILPVMNPDGYEYSHTHDRMWRKNRAWVRGQCVGVDLNRNFSCGWGGKGSSENPYNSFFRGAKPFSEPESSAVRDVISNSGISFKVYITLHSFGQLIILPFAYSDDLCPDYVRLLEGATVMSKAIYESSGNIYKVGVSKDVMYKAAGTSNDWSHGVAKIPYCYLIELRSKKHKFQLPKEEIEETGQEILNCVKALMEFVDNYQLEKKTCKDENHNM